MVSTNWIEWNTNFIPFFWTASNSIQIWHHTLSHKHNRKFTKNFVKFIFWETKWKKNYVSFLKCVSTIEKKCENSHNRTYNIPANEYIHIYICFIYIFCLFCLICYYQCKVVSCWRTWFVCFYFFLSSSSFILFLSFLFFLFCVLISRHLLVFTISIELYANILCHSVLIPRKNENTHIIDQHLECQMIWNSIFLSSSSRARHFDVQRYEFEDIHSSRARKNIYIYINTN